MDPHLKQTDWWGAGSFRAFLALYVEDLTYEGSPTPGYVFDPRRHSRDDLPASGSPELSDFQQRMSVVSGAPRLTSAAYAALFTAMAADLAVAPYNRTETSKRVRDRTDLAGQSVGRSSVDFVLQGLIYSGVDLTGSPTAESLAEGWIANVTTLCVNAGMALTQSDEDALRAWIGGALPGALRPKGQS